jgi:hypothetical protein
LACCIFFVAFFSLEYSWTQMNFVNTFPLKIHELQWVQRQTRTLECHRNATTLKSIVDINCGKQTQCWYKMIVPSE